MGELIYLPAVSMGDVSNSKFSEALMRDKGVKHNFLDKEKSAFYYPYILMSAYYGQAEPDMKEKYGLKDVFILGDSGGFQNVTLNANLDPVKVLEWQEKNCTSGLMLDVPPFEATGGAAFGKTHEGVFYKSMEASYKNAIIGLLNKKNPDFKLLGVVQGDTFQRKIEWYHKMREAEVKCEREFDGWALSPKPSSDIREIAQHFVLMKEQKISKPLHVLQVTGFEGLAIVAYMSTKHESYITVDSSTFSYGRRFFLYKSPYDVKTSYHLGKNKDNDLKELPCNCPICSLTSLTELNEEKELGEKTVPGVLISLHNLYQTVRYVKFLNSIKEDKILFRKFCEENFGESFIELMNYIDDALVIGNEKSWRKHVLKSFNLNSFFEPEEGEPTVAEVEVEVKIKTPRELLSDIFDEYGDIDIKNAIKLWEHKTGVKWTFA